MLLRKHNQEVPLEILNKEKKSCKENYDQIEVLMNLYQINSHPTQITDTNRNIYTMYFSVSENLWHFIQVIKSLFKIKEPTTMSDLVRKGYRSFDHYEVLFEIDDNWLIIRK